MIEHFKLQLFVVTDIRRIITDITIPEDIKIPFEVHQVKVVALTEEAVKSQMPVGNHYHTSKSGREEFFVAVGRKGVPLFSFMFREGIGYQIQQKIMFAGDACYIPTEHSHTFVGLEEGAVLWGFSNQAYDASHDVEDKLFIPPPSE